MAKEADNKRQGPTRESGKRLYVSPQDYQEQIRRGTIKAFDQGIAPWSEYEKPYWEDSYEEMEYFMWNWPGFAPWRWQFSIDNPSIPTTEQASLGGTDFIVCDCFTLGGFCPGERRCIAMDCNYPIIGVQFSQSFAEREFALELENEQTLCITAVEDASLGVEVDIFMRLPSGAQCSEDDFLIGTAQDCEDCATADPLAASPDNPTTVTDGTNYRIEVIDGVPPFTWTLAAPDSPNVALQWVAGNNRYNYLNVVDGCGSIIVTVIDSCGTILELPFLSDDGVWQDCSGGQRGGSGCTCGGAGFDIEGPTFGNGVPSGDEFRFNHNNRRWRLIRTISTPCDGLNFPTCCQDQNPDCSANDACLHQFDAGNTCANFGYPGIVAPCFNDCGGKGATPKCGVRVRTGDGHGFDFFRCA